MNKSTRGIALDGVNGRWTHSLKKITTPQLRSDIGLGLSLESRLKLNLSLSRVLTLISLGLASFIIETPMSSAETPASLAETPASSREQPSAQDTQTSPHSSEYHLETPDTGARGPWIMCLLIEGPNAVYPAQVYAVQARYGSWTSVWRRHRPRGYDVDEDVGLLTAEALKRTMREIQRAAHHAGLKAKITDAPPPCDSAQVATRPQLQTRKASLIAWVWIRHPHSERPRWHLWRLSDPHLSPPAQDMSGGVLSIIHAITGLIYTTIERRADRDRLVLRGEYGTLRLNVSRPARVYINGVDHGVWPQRELIELPTGDYDIYAIPIAAGYDPVTYTEVGVIRGRQTNFMIDLE